MERKNRTAVETKIDRLERAVAQLASALRVCSGWRPSEHGQAELDAILTEARELIELERRPQIAEEVVANA